jgi:hypothetical protein
VVAVLPTVGAVSGALLAKISGLPRGHVEVALVLLEETGWITRAFAIQPVAIQLTPAGQYARRRQRTRSTPAAAPLATPAGEVAA